MDKLARLLEKQASEDHSGEELEKLASNLYWQGRIIGAGIADELMLHKEAGIKDFFAKQKNSAKELLSKIKNSSAVNRVKSNKAYLAASGFARKHRKALSRTGYGLGLAGAGYAGYEYGRRKGSKK